MAPPKTVFFFNTFVVACFNHDGHQVPELQCSLVRLWAEYCATQDCDVNGVVVESPTGRFRIVKGETGWNSEEVK